MSTEVTLWIDELETRIMELIDMREAFKAANEHMAQSEAYQRALRDYDIEIACYRAELDAWTNESDCRQGSQPTSNGAYAYA